MSTQIPNRMIFVIRSPDKPNLSDVKILDPSVPEAEQQPLHLKGCSAIAVSPDGTVVAIALNDTLELYDVNSMERIPSFEGKHRGVYHLAFIPAGTTLWSFGEEEKSEGSTEKTGTINLWDIITGKLLVKCKTCICSSGPYTFTDLTISPEGRTAVVSTNRSQSPTHGEEWYFIYKPGP